MSLLGITLPVFASGALPVDTRPEQVFDLYARALVNDDADSTRQLNDLLRPVFDGKDVIETGAATAMRHAMVSEGLEGRYLPGSAWVLALIGTDTRTVCTDLGTAPPSPDSYMDNLCAALPEATAAYVAALDNARCHAISSGIADDPAVAGGRIAAVQFECTVADLRLHHRDIALCERADGPAMAELLRRQSAMAEASSATRVIHGDIELYSDAGAGWHTGDTARVLAPVVDALTRDYCAELMAR